MTSRSKEVPQLDTFGGRLAAVRSARRMTLNEAANATGTSKTSFCNWQNDSVKPRDIRQLYKFCRMTEITIDWLLNRDGPDPSFIASHNKMLETTHSKSIKMTTIPEIAPDAPIFEKVETVFVDDSCWSIPRDVIDLVFRGSPENCVIQRVISGGPEMSRGDYILIDTSRTRMDEPGYYIFPDPDNKNIFLRVRRDRLTREVTIDIDCTRKIPPDAPVLGKIVGHFRPL